MPSTPNRARHFVEYLELRMKQPHFANARSVRNAIDRMKLRQASRVGRAGRLHSQGGVGSHRGR